MILSILLAAGGSSRMVGEINLVKEIKGIPLIKHSIKSILGSSVNEIIVVLGYEKDVVKSLIEANKKIKFVYNKDYESGMASSIKIGIENISNRAEAFFISLGDMPKVNQSIYNKLIKARCNYNKKLKVEYKKEFIIPTFEGKKGNPILVSKQAKGKIINVKGDYGAREIIELNKNKTLYIPVKNKGVMIDYDYHEDFNSS